MRRGPSAPARPTLCSRARRTSTSAWSGERRRRSSKPGRRRGRGVGEPRIVEGEHARNLGGGLAGAGAAGADIDGVVVVVERVVDRGRKLVRVVARVQV